MRAVTVQAASRLPILEDDFLSLVPSDLLLLDELDHLFHARSSPSWTHIPRNLLAVVRIKGAGMQSGEDNVVGDPGHVRTLNVLGLLHTVEFALVHTLHTTHSTAPGEGGRGRFGFFLCSLAPILLLDWDLSSTAALRR